MSPSVIPLPIHELDEKSFAPFGDILDVKEQPDMLINGGLCERFHDLAILDFQGEKARPGISLFRSKACSLPYQLDLMERHPLGSQAFIPMTQDPFLVIVAEDRDGKPDRPKAFLTKAGQGVNYHRNIWHGVLTPLIENALFAVIDRIGEGNNLQEHTFETPYIIHNI